tara:strand:- start:464 stop:1006 length:543 start_codon:yes stop_codon:yes gene_type:complete
MKKLLGIVVLGFILFNAESADASIYCYNPDNDKIETWNSYSKCPGNRVQVAGLNSKKPPRFEGLKKTCIDIGYTTGTEKFADCVKDLYVKQLEAKNIAQSQTTTTTTSQPKRRIDPSVWDDIISLSTGAMSSKSKTPRKVCFKTGEEKIGFGKSCRYSCTGSLYTMMVGSMEMCPLTVDR